MVDPDILIKVDQWINNFGLWAPFFLFFDCLGLNSNTSCYLKWIALEPDFHKLAEWSG